MDEVSVDEFSVDEVALDEIGASGQSGRRTMSPAEGAGARVHPFDPADDFDPARLDDDPVRSSRTTTNRSTTNRTGTDRAAGRPGASQWTGPTHQPRGPEQRYAPGRGTRPQQPHTPDGSAGPARPPRPDPGIDRTAIRSGVRLNGLWCAVLLVLGVAAALALAGALSWRPGVPMTIVLAAIGVGVALLAGRGGGFEAGILPGTVVIVVGAVVVAFDSSALGGAVAGLGPVSRVWQAIGLLAPAAAATWVCALVTLGLRRAGLLRRF